MLRLNTLFLAVSAVSVVTATKTCCPPAQWEADVTMMINILSNGHVSHVEGTMKLSWDSVNRLSAMDQTLTVNHDTALIQTIVSDYNTGVSYGFHGEQCARQPLYLAVYGCIPENATRETYRYGLGNDTVDVTGYHVDYVDFQLYTAVTTDTCVPVSQTIIVNKDNSSSTTEFLVYSNVTPGLKTRSVFDIPAQCKDEHLQTPQVGRKRTLLGIEY